MTPIRQRLREATQPFHASLEQTLGLGLGNVDRAGYGRALQVLHAVRSGWEPSLATFLPDSVGPHRAWLEADLRHLDLLPLPPAPTPPIRTEPQAWGARYVLEGSALGGRALLALVAPMGLTMERGARFFAGAGSQTGAHWAAFLARLNQAATEDAAGAIIQGATDAFATLDRFAAKVMARRPDRLSSLR